MPASADDLTCRAGDKKRFPRPLDVMATESQSAYQGVTWIVRGSKQAISMHSSQ